MRGMGMRAEELEVGRRWATARRFSHGIDQRHPESMGIERIADFDREAVETGGGVRVTLETADGTRRDVVMTRASVETTGGVAVVWTDPLPADDGVALALVAAANTDTSQRRATLLWIGAVEGDIAYCHLVTDDRHAGDRHLSGDAGCMRISGVARAVRFDRPVTARSLVAVTRGRATIETGRCVHAPGSERTVMREASLEDVVAIPTAAARRTDVASGNFSGAEHLDEAEEWAWAASKPSEALVLVVDDDGEDRTIVLGSGGTAFHNQDDAATYLEDKMPGPGLWAFVNAKTHSWEDHEGGWDQEIDGDAVPATIEVMERLVGPEAMVAAEIAGHTGVEADVAALIERAANASMDVDLYRPGAR